MIKISVIIPIYNMEEYVANCLETVLGQTLREIEAICVNDGSADNSEQIVKELQKKDDRIKLISQENQGVARARNNAMKIAKGEFIIFMDPDDWYPSDDILETLYNKAKEKNVLICGGGFSEVSGDKVITDFKGAKAKYKFDKEELIDYKEYQFDYGYHRFIYNREFLEENNIIFPPYIRFQDPPFFVKAMITAKEFYALDKVVYAYRAGYRKIEWTEPKLNDLLRGLTDILRLSGENDLEELHRLTLKRMSENYFNMYSNHKGQASPDFFKLLFEFDNCIKDELIKDIAQYEKYKYVIYNILNDTNNNENKLLKQELADKTKIIKKKNKQIKKIKSSKSYKIGRAITWLPRKISKLFK